MSKMVKLNNIGDTIVEVLLAIAIVSAVLGGAFASANKSSQGIRQSQERGEALKLLEEQLESLKHAKDTNTIAKFTDFCFVGIDSYESSQEECFQGTKDGPKGRYHVVLRHTDSASRDYTATATWAKIGGGDEQKIQIEYRTEK